MRFYINNLNLILVFGTKLYVYLLYISLTFASFGLLYFKFNGHVANVSANTPRSGGETGKAGELCPLPKIFFDF